MTTESRSVPTKVLQPHGGALNSGGTPGNRGGIGRPPSEVRRLAREIFAARLSVLDQIAEGRITVPLRERCTSCGHEPALGDEELRERAIERAVRPGEQVRAMEALARVGMSGNVSVDDIRVRMIAQVRATREWGSDNGVAPELVDQLLERHHACWRGP